MIYNSDSINWEGSTVTKLKDFSDDKTTYDKVTTTIYKTLSAIKNFTAEHSHCSEPSDLFEQT